MADIRVPNSEACVRVLRADARPLTQPAGARDARATGLAAVPGAMVDRHGAGPSGRGGTQGLPEPFWRDVARELVRACRHTINWRSSGRKQGSILTRKWPASKRQRGVSLALVDSMPEGAGERSGDTRNWECITIAQLLNEFAFHDLGHIRQVMELYRVAGILSGDGRLSRLLQDQSIVGRTYRSGLVHRTGRGN